MIPQVSIIVPIYNTEKYLDKCIQSILCQTFVDFEVLLVNDGSTDNSGKICDEYVCKDNRIKVFHQRNRGVSAARNRGLSMVKGTYILFLDGDDYWMSEDCLKLLVDEAIKRNADIVRGEYIAVDPNGNTLSERPLNKRKKECAYHSISSVRYLNDVIQGDFFLVLSLIRYEKIANLKFNEGQVFLEDVDFYLRLLLQPLKCVFIPLRFYAYRKHNASASSAKSIRLLSDSFQMCNRFAEYICLTDDKCLKDYMGKRSVMMYYWTLKTLANDYYSDRIEYINKLDLTGLQQITCWRLRKFKVFNLCLPFIVLPPRYGVFLIHWENKIEKKIRTILRMIVCHCKCSNITSNA